MQGAAQLLQLCPHSPHLKVFQGSVEHKISPLLPAAAQYTRLSFPSHSLLLFRPWLKCLARVLQQANPLQQGSLSQLQQEFHKVDSAVEPPHQVCQESLQP